MAAHHDYADVDTDTNAWYSYSTPLQLPFCHRTMCGDASGLISTASDIIPQSRCCLGWNNSLWPGVAQFSYLAPEIGLKIPLNCEQLTIAVTAGTTPPLYPMIPNPASVRGRIWMKTTRSAGLYPIRSDSVAVSWHQLPQHMLSMNLLSRSLFNWDEYHSYPAKGFCNWKFWGCLGQALGMSGGPNVISLISTHH